MRNAKLAPFNRWNRRHMAALFIVFVLTLGMAAQAQTYTVLHSFAGPPDGIAPFAGVTRDAAGNLYGNTADGGMTGKNCQGYGCGMIFKLDQAGTETVLYTFTGGADGGAPFGSLIRDAAGNLYGTTSLSSSFGAVFKLDSASTYTVLYSFTGGADGAEPDEGLIRDAAGNLYGVTFGGGDLICSCGVVFKLDSAGTETVLHSFTGGSDGEGPLGRLLRDGSGNLYGTTGFGGTYSGGTIFKLDPTGTETVLHSFNPATEGHEPAGTLVRDAAGNLYGVTLTGPVHIYGMVYKLDTAGTLTILHSFSGKRDGETPEGGLLRSASGTLYGTTVSGGSHMMGTIFKLTPAGKFTLLYTFTGGSDGGHPAAALIPDAAGNLYSTAVYGGYGFGVVFKIASH
ncbi:MAG: hypothetical protein LAN83_17190 [Acidobacteriia bacterium]|nr:hypothetical protein [Terriglobia bacterium]